MALVSFIIVSAGLFNWIADLLAPSVTLPPEIMQDAGASLDMKQLAREAKAVVIG